MSYSLPSRNVRLGRLEGPWRGARRLGMTLRVSAADPFGQLTAASAQPYGVETFRQIQRRLEGPWRGTRWLGMTLRVSAADPLGQLTAASVFVGGIALVKFPS